MTYYDNASYVEISIHAPRMGCDITECAFVTVGNNFNPRTPYGVRPLSLVGFFCIDYISIHAPRMGCDQHLDGIPVLPEDFNPRTPYGVRRRKNRRKVLD